MLRYPEPPVTSEGEAALVLWPYGTRWDPDGLAVVTPLGDVLAIGTAVEGGGGYWNADSVEQLAGPEAAELARRCADGEHREIARVNNLPDGIGPAVDD